MYGPVGERISTTRIAVQFPISSLRSALSPQFISTNESSQVHAGHRSPLVGHDNGHASLGGEIMGGEIMGGEIMGGEIMVGAPRGKYAFWSTLH